MSKETHGSGAVPTGVSLRFLNNKNNQADRNLIRRLEHFRRQRTSSMSHLERDRHEMHNFLRQIRKCDSERDTAAQRYLSAGVDGSSPLRSARAMTPTAKSLHEFTPVPAMTKSPENPKHSNDKQISARTRDEHAVSPLKQCSPVAVLATPTSPRHMVNVGSGKEIPTKSPLRSRRSFRSKHSCERKLVCNEELVASQQAHECEQKTKLNHASNIQICKSHIEDSNSRMTIPASTTGHEDFLPNISEQNRKIMLEVLDLKMRQKRRQPLKYRIENFFEKIRSLREDPITVNIVRDDTQNAADKWIYIPTAEKAVSEVSSTPSFENKLHTI